MLALVRLSLLFFARLPLNFSLNQSFCFDFPWISFHFSRELPPDLN
jgi:hypothetical protein